MRHPAAYATAWAAHGRYELIDGSAAFLQLVLVAAVGVALALRERSDMMSAVGAAGAVAAPILVGGLPAGVLAIIGYQVSVLVVAVALYLTRWAGG